MPSHSTVGVIELMPACDGRLYAFKYVNGHPSNTRVGLLTVTAFGVLADVETGYPLLLSELTLTTALRTAATSRAGRPPHGAARQPRHGADRQRRAERVPDASPSTTCSACAKCGCSIPTPAPPTSSSATSRGCTCRASRWCAAPRPPPPWRGADIVTTVTADKCNATILTPEMIAPGMHLNAVGGDCPGKTELHPDILRRPDVRVVVEFEPQSRIEGEIQQMDAAYPVTELTRVLAGSAPGRARARTR